MTEDLKWIERLPNGWTVQPLKFVAHVQPSNVNKIASDDEIPVRLCNYTDVYKNEFIVADMEFMRSTATSLEIEKFHLEVDDVIITKDSETADDIAIPAYVKETADDLVCGYHLTMMRPNAAKLSGRYLHRVFGSKELRAQLELAAKGVTRVGIPQDSIGRASIPIPPLPTQHRIADYLDAETLRIDQLIAAKRSMLALLEKKRAALVSQAVTKGLDPKAKMKDSGLEWLGEIPAHWEMRRLAQFGPFYKGSGIARADITESGLPAITYGDIYTQYDVQAEQLVKFTSEEVAQKAQQILSGDLLLTGSGETIEDIGKCVVYLGAVPAYAGGDIILLRQTLANSHYLSYMLNSPLAVAQKMQMARGDIIVHIYGSSLRNLMFPLPPADEQRRILQFLEKDRKRVEVLSKTLNDSIVLLVRRRSALITAAVTGQLFA